MRVTAVVVPGNTMVRSCILVSPTLEIRNCCKLVVSCDADSDVVQAPVKSSIKITSNLHISLFTIAVPFWSDMGVVQIIMNRITNLLSKRSRLTE